MATLAVMAPSLAAAEPDAYVTNQASEDRVWVLDTETNTVIDTVTIEDIPARVAITPDGAFAYVTIVVDEDALQQAGPTLLSSVQSSPVFLGAYAKSQSSTSFFSNKVAVIDTAEKVVVETITTDVAPFGIAISPDGEAAWVTHLGPAVTVIDIATNTVTDTVTLPLAGEVTDIAITPDGAFAYAPVTFADGVAVFDTASRTVAASIPVSGGPIGVAITPDGKHAYVTSVRADTVSVIDVAANAIVATVPVSDGPTGIAVTPDGGFAYVLNQLSGDVSVIETASNTVVATIIGGETPIDVAIRPDGAFAYVTELFMDSVRVIDTATHALVDTVPVGFLPEGIAITPASTVLEAMVDIKPGNDRNRINPRSQGGIWVAVLSTEGFDALMIDTPTVRFGPGETPVLRTGVRDVNMDGTQDLLLRFHVADAGIGCGDTEAALTGRTMDGQEIAGEDAIETVGCAASVVSPVPVAVRRFVEFLAECRSNGQSCSAPLARAIP